MTFASGRRLGLVFLTVALAFSVLCAQGPVPSSLTHHGLDPANLDKSVPPTQNFYKFSNGGWLAANPIPAEYARWGSFSELNEKNFRDLSTILDEAAQNSAAPKGSTTQKVGDFYASAMDSVAAENDGIKALAPEFSRIAAASSSADIVAIVAHQHTALANPIFQFYVGQDAKSSAEVIAQVHQGGLGLPDKDYYTKEDDKSKEIRTAYLDHLQKMFQLLGDDAATSEAEAKTVMAIETRLANASMSRVQRRDPNATYHRMSLGELADLAPGFDWKGYFAGIGKAQPGPINVGQPDFFKEVSTMMRDVPLADWKTYLRWHTSMRPPHG